MTYRGECVDYWIGDKEFVLEVSGQESGHLRHLYKVKLHQFLDNPMEKDGYVCVANYSEGSARFGFHAYESR